MWLPYQAAYEYQDNREEVIKSSAKAHSEALLVFDGALRDFNKLLGPDYNKHFIDPKELTKSVIEEIEKARGKLRSYGTKKTKKGIRSYKARHT